MTFLKAQDIADSLVFALQAPDHVDLAELFIMPTSQPWQAQALQQVTGERRFDLIAALVAMCFA